MLELLSGMARDEAGTEKFDYVILRKEDGDLTMKVSILRKN